MVGVLVAAMAMVVDGEVPVGVGVGESGSEPPPQTSRTVKMTAAKMMTMIKKPQARERIVVRDLLVSV
jgi:hypothetical protein